MQQNLSRKFARPRLVKKILWNAKFITKITRAGRLSLSLARSIQSMLSHPHLEDPFKLSSHLCLGLPSDLSLSLSFSYHLLQIPVCNSQVSLLATWSAQLILLDLITAQYLVSSTDHKAPHYVIFSNPVLPRPS